MNQPLGTSHEPRSQTPDGDEAAPPRRMFLFERGWRIGVKSGSDREFCYMMAPGEDCYHRLLDGEIFLASADEKLCLDCSARRGLIAHAPKRLRDFIVPIDADMEAVPLELDSRDVKRSSGRSVDNQ